MRGWSAPGAGLAELFAAEGVAWSPTATEDAMLAEVLAAIRATGAGRVVLLPERAPTAPRATPPRPRGPGTPASGSAVVPTRSPVQALAALAVRDAGRRFDDDVIAMAEAAGA